MSIAINSKAHALAKEKSLCLAKIELNGRHAGKGRIAMSGAVSGNIENKIRKLMDEWISEAHHNKQPAKIAKKPDYALAPDEERDAYINET